MLCNHIVAVAVASVYCPLVAAIVFAYMHLVGFIGILITNVFIYEAEPGQGNKTLITRILWGGKSYIYASYGAGQHRPHYNRFDWGRSGHQGWHSCKCVNFISNFIFEL